MGSKARIGDIRSQLYHTIGQYFGILYRDDIGKTGYKKNQGIHNYMFNLNSNGENQMEKLVETMLSLDAAGEPTIATLKDVEVIDNPFWGISGGWKLDFTLCLFTGVPTKFANESFKSVPNVDPVPMNLPAGQLGSFLPPLPARMTQIMLSWAIKHSWDGLEVNGEIKFGGFRAIF